MSCLPLTSWLFGKLPSHGDFIARGLAPDLREKMDLWLSDEMARAREDHGDDFETLYDAAPPWRFVDGAAGGVICASIDSAGRRFPILAGMGTGSAEQAGSAAEASETAIFRAFELGSNADGLAAILAESGIEEGDPPVQTGWWVDGGDEFLPGRWPNGLISRMLGTIPGGYGPQVETA